MTATDWVLIGLCALALLLIVAFWAAERVAHMPEQHVPQHGKWIQDGETTRLAPQPTWNERKNAGLLRPTEVFLVPEPGEGEWRFPPAR